jgi:protein-S-isoprenylcysteine O-methyltransferase Ste14
MKSNNQKRNDRSELLLSRRQIPIVWAVIILIIHVLLPWAVARIGPRYGWTQQVPGWWNLAGLVIATIGVGLYVWCLVFHYRSYRTSVRVGFTPPHLVIAGPYRFSRNPMYVTGLIAWLGWVIFYGSPAVFVGHVLLWVIFTIRVIPYEERQLEGLFGDEYLDFKRSVPRWIGRF